MDTRALAVWYRASGRHDMPWRQTRDPWPVLVSEVMLQQTPVSRVLGPWHRFLTRWPTPQACASAPLDDVLREWRGLGYPRRARALWSTAQIVATEGWPTDEAGLRRLPGIGVYTARALLWITQDRPTSPPPRDVNIARLAARSAFDTEAWQQPPDLLDARVVAARPRGMAARDYVYSLFDVGSAHCRATPLCDGCPLASACAARTRLSTSPPPPPPRRQARYEGSLRQLRGAVLEAILTGIDDRAALELRLGPLAESPARVDEALVGLVKDGLIAASGLSPSLTPTGLSERFSQACSGRTRGVL